MVVPHYKGANQKGYWEKLVVYKYLILLNNFLSFDECTDSWLYPLD